MTGSDISVGQLAQADAVATLSQQAAELCEQAGRGLLIAFEKCKTNTADAETLATVLLVQACVTDAARCLLKREGVRTQQPLVLT